MWRKMLCSDEDRNVTLRSTCCVWRKTNTAQHAGCLFSESMVRWLKLNTGQSWWRLQQTWDLGGGSASGTATTLNIQPKLQYNVFHQSIFMCYNAPVKVHNEIENMICTKTSLTVYRCSLSCLGWAWALLQGWKS